MNVQNVKTCCQFLNDITAVSSAQLTELKETAMLSSRNWRLATCILPDKDILFCYTAEISKWGGVAKTSKKGAR